MCEKFLKENQKFCSQPGSKINSKIIIIISIIFGIALITIAILKLNSPKNLEIETKQKQVIKTPVQTLQ